MIIINNPVGSSVAGSNTQIQFNSNGVLGADPKLYWDNTGKTLNIGAGDNLTGYQFAAEGTKPATHIDVRSGVLSPSPIPNTTPRPIFKAQTFQEVTSAQVGSGDGVDSMATIAGVSLGFYACEAQTVGVYGAATNLYNNVAGGSFKGDTVGGYFLGVKNAYGNGSSYGTALGIYSAGRRDDATAKITAAEIQCQNYTSTSGSYSSTGFSDTNGIWMTANGNADSGVGLSIGNPFNKKFKVGIGFSGWNGGAVVDSTFRDDSTSTTSLDVRGTHTYSITTSSTAGKAGIGTLTPTAQLEINSSAANIIGQIVQAAASQTANVSEWRNSAGTVQLAIDSTGRNFVLDTTNGTKIGTSTSQKLGFYNATPVVQQTGGANTAGVIYSSTEQTMLQTAYNCLRTLGLLS
jgi:hypothetical protein